MLRGVQHIIDKVTGQKFTIYQWIKKNDFLRPILGTMLHECFGIPYMHCYTKNELKKINKEKQMVQQFDSTAQMPRKKMRKGGRSRNTRRMNRLEELGRVDAERARTRKGKRNLKAEKRRVIRELKRG